MTSKKGLQELKQRALGLQYGTYWGRTNPTCPSTLLWSSRVKAVIFSRGIEGAFSARIRALVLAGLATTTTCQNKSRYWPLPDTVRLFNSSDISSRCISPLHYHSRTSQDKALSSVMHQLSPHIARWWKLQSDLLL